MNNKRIQLIVLTMITLSIFAFDGCSSSSTTSGTANGAATASTSGTTVYGKVTGISGSEITIALGTMNEGGGEKPTGEAPTGDQTSETQSTAEIPPAQPTDGTTPPAGTIAGAPEMLTLTGESQTITLSDTITITRQTMPEPGTQSSSTKANNDESASSADIAVGSMLMIVYAGSSEEIASIQIMGGGQQGATPTVN
ncbi:hypothetical protein GH811_12565 [Acetobacterium malicum]|uniref:DUF5666 domain-containing protein n=1 Tax=Acetobacterium malicum TaxID=52692 RepID=A0ABR6YYZ3_9FIRM|nr:hypothetical protein [Acetobacterium malicum]MBC3900453.1 hypothetical protein [Acetobacterium malicum]